MIEEQKARAESRKRREKRAKKLKKLKVWKYTDGFERRVEVETPDHGSLKELWDKYGTGYDYYCAQFPPEYYQIFCDPDKARKHVEDNRDKYEYQLRKKSVDQFIKDAAKFNAVKYYGDHTAWIDLKHNVILVEKAG